MTVPVLGEVLVNQNKAIELLLAEQRKRDLEEFREMIVSEIGATASSGDETDLIQFALKRLNGFIEQIDAKLSEIKT